VARNLRRGFARLVAVLWACGALGLLWWSGDVLRWPLEDVCRKGVEPPHRECFTEEALALAESERFTERLLGRFRQGWEGIDAERHVPRWRTERYQRDVVALARRQLIWAALAWGPFALLAWAFAGFRGEREP
jgi:hypothetical protein